MSKDSDEYDLDDEPRLHEIAEEEITKYREEERWIGNKDLQREDHVGACEELGIRNPNIPRLPGMLLSAKFQFWQPVAVKALKDFEEGDLRGGILADEVGIGKTWEVIGLEQYVSLVRAYKLRNAFI